MRASPTGGYSAWHRYQRDAVKTLAGPVRDELAAFGLTDSDAHAAAHQIAARLDDELPRLDRSLATASARWLIAALRHGRYQRTLATAHAPGLAAVTTRLLDAIDQATCPLPPEVTAAADEARAVRAALTALAAADADLTRASDYPGHPRKRGQDGPAAIDLHPYLANRRSPARRTSRAR